MVSISHITIIKKQKKQKERLNQRCLLTSQGKWRVRSTQHRWHKQPDGTKYNMHTGFSINILGHPKCMNKGRLKISHELKDT